MRARAQVAFDRGDDSLYVADGESQPNARVVKLVSSGSGGALRVGWVAGGGPGNGTTLFQDPHTLDADELGRVVVGDRNNWRIKVRVPSLRDSPVCTR